MHKTIEQTKMVTILTNIFQNQKLEKFTQKTKKMQKTNKYKYKIQKKNKKKKQKKKLKYKIQFCAMKIAIFAIPCPFCLPNVVLVSNHVF